jgi:hypothetical protein
MIEENYFGPQEFSTIDNFHRVQIQTTSVCNGQCIMCPYPESWHAAHPGQMQDTVFEKIVSEISKVSLDKICPYLENEPFADPAIFERTETIMQDCTFKLIEFSTNAQLLNAGKQERLARLLEGVPHEIWISFHGVDKNRYENIMRLPFEQALNNVIDLLHLADEADLKLVIRCAGKPLNRAIAHNFQCSQEEFESFWADIFSKNDIKKTPRLVYFGYHDRCGGIKRNCIRMRKIIREDLTNVKCPRIFGWLHFLYTGELILCCMDYHRETVFGDISVSNLEDIVCGHKARNLRSQALGMTESPANFICKRCLHPGG